jgi:anti-anti-sigma regulatory factor
MFSIEADRSKRLVVISVAGSVSAAEVKEAAKRVREIVHEIAPGFRALIDYQWLEKMETAAAQYIAEMMDALASRGVSSVIRVVPDPHKDIGLNILSRFHYGPEIHVMTYESLADAVQGLANDIGAD